MFKRMQAVMKKFSEWSGKASANREELKRGTALDPINHPSYSPAKVATMTKAESSRARSIKSAETRYKNAVNDA